MPLIPLLIGFFSSFFTRLGLLFVGLIPIGLSRLATLLGVGIVSYSGFSIGIEYLRQEVFSKFAGLSSDILNVLLLHGIDTGMAMVFSAMSVALAVRVVCNTGTKKKLSIGNVC